MDPQEQSLQTKRHVSEIRYQLLSYAGVVGGALTLLGSFDSVLRLTHFVKVVASSWVKWTDEVWRLLFGAFSIPVYEDVFLDLTFCVMLLSTGIGGQLWWRKITNSTSPLLKIDYVIGWHIPAGLAILILDFQIRPLFQDRLDLLYDRSISEYLFTSHFIGSMLIAPVVYFFTFKWTSKETWIGIFYVLIIINVLVAGRFFADYSAAPEVETAHSSFVTFVAHSLTATLIILIAAPNVLLRRIRHLVFVFVFFALLNAIQEPLLDVLRILFGDF